MVAAAGLATGDLLHDIFPWEVSQQSFHRRLVVDTERKKRQDDLLAILPNQLERQKCRVNYGDELRDGQKTPFEVISIQTALKQNVSKWTFVFLKAAEMH